MAESVADRGMETRTPIGIHEDVITTCPICCETLKDPRLLPCQHTFCLPCLQRLAHRKQSDLASEITCPLCRATVAAPRGDVTALPVNEFARGLIELIAKIKSQMNDSLTAEKSFDVDAEYVACCKKSPSGSSNALQKDVICASGCDKVLETRCTEPRYPMAVCSFCNVADKSTVHGSVSFLTFQHVHRIFSFIKWCNVCFITTECRKTLRVKPGR